ncbi:MAG: transposase [Chloroflexi bacterium]|nr:transposase [Chloroflexota bacterium]
MSDESATIVQRYEPGKCHRRSIRLKNYDYSQAGAYFITVCTQGRECLFGGIADGEVRMNEYGEIVHQEWLQAAILRPSVELDAFVVMPNHVHGIVVLRDGGRGTLQRAPTLERFGKPTSSSIPTIVRLFKSVSTRRINATRQTPGAAVWQRNYYEHVIRNENELKEIREYIMNNPLKWELDEENPDNAKCGGLMKHGR